jgi:hypothetical protein
MKAFGFRVHVLGFRAGGSKLGCVGSRDQGVVFGLQRRAFGVKRSGLNPRP